MSDSISTKGMLNLIVVYLVWGSTYLFIRLTVQEGSGFPPFAMAASRTLCASAILFILAVVFGHRLRLSVPELRVLIASGLLLWVGGNGLVVWAYLVIAGSLISFTSYVIAVRTLPISVVMTYAYINPVIAVILGWLVLGERITTSTIMGTGLIFIGVSGVFWKRFGPGGK